MKEDRRGQRNEEGFSLIELVIAMGIMLILNTGGILTYTNVVESFRENTVSAVAAGVLNTAREYKLNFEPSDVPEDAEAEFMRDRADTSITVVVEDSENCLKVTATHDRGNTSTETYGDCVAE